MATTIEFTRINNDTNGNPRYVFHYLNLLSDQEQSTISVFEKYAYAINKARAIGGRKYHTKGFGGGIVFHESNESTIESKIKSIL